MRDSLILWLKDIVVVFINIWKERAEKKTAAAASTKFKIHHIQISIETRASSWEHEQTKTGRKRKKMFITRWKCCRRRESLL